MHRDPISTSGCSGAALTGGSPDIAQTSVDISRWEHDLLRAWGEEEKKGKLRHVTFFFSLAFAFFYSPENKLLLSRTEMASLEYQEADVYVGTNRWVGWGQSDHITSLFVL